MSSWDRRLLRSIDQRVSNFSIPRMATIPVYSPLSPFIGLIPGGLRPGIMIRLKGVMPISGHRFMINLQAGCVLQPRDDVALHLSVRSNEHCIVRNHMTNQVWGSEERFGGMPLHPGQPFDILILVEATSFKIAINNVHYCMFQFRLPYHRVQFVNVEGDVTLHSITMEGDNYQPPSAPVPVAPIYPTLAPPSHHFQPGRPPHWSVGAVPVLPPHAPTPPPPPSYSPYPPGHHHVATAYAPTMATAFQPPHKKKSSSALKAAAIVGGVGLGAFAISRAFTGDSGENNTDGFGSDAGGEE